jgi:hypothetical protein
MKRSPPKPDDWRRQGQDRFLKGRRWSLQTYQAYREEWDHDHCEFCGAKFSLADEDLHRGYVTDDSYHWVCESCFADFRDEMGWMVVSELGA